MDAYLQLIPARRRILCEEAAGQLGLRILPRDEQRDAWARDYAAMRETMFFDEPPTFEVLLQVVGEFQRGFNSRRQP